MSLPAQRALMTIWLADQFSFKEWSQPIHFELVGTFGAGYDINAAAVALDTLLQSHILAVISADATYLGLDIRINNNGVYGDAGVVTQQVGGAASGIVPTEVAAVVHLQTATPGRIGRGRNFWTGFAASQVSGGRVTSGLKTVLSSLYTLLNTPFVNQGISWQMRLYSKGTKALPNKQLLPISSFVVNSLCGTQRRRRPRR